MQAISAAGTFVRYMFSSVILPSLWRLARTCTAHLHVACSFTSVRKGRPTRRKAPRIFIVSLYSIRSRLYQAPAPAPRTSIGIGFGHTHISISHISISPYHDFNSTSQSHTGYLSSCRLARLERFGDRVYDVRRLLCSSRLGHDRYLSIVHRGRPGITAPHPRYRSCRASFRRVVLIH